MGVDAFLRLAQLLPEAMVLLTARGEVRAANPGMADLFGCRPADLAGRNLAELTTESAEHLRAYLHACSRSTSLLPGAMTLVTDDGKQHACRVQGARFHEKSGDEQPLIFCRLTRKAAANRFVELNQRIDDLGREMLRRRSAERALEAQSRLLRVTLASIGDSVITTDMAGLVTFMNGSAEAQTGWPQGEALGRSLNEIFVLIDEGTRAPVANPTDEALRTGRVVALANHTVLLCRDGSERPIADSCAPIRDDAGNTLGAVLVFHDMTERRNLQREVQSRTDKLIELDQRKDEFIAMLAHELRNPLAPLRNGVNILQLAHAKETAQASPVERSVAAMMLRQVNQLTRLVDDLLDVTRINRGHIKLVRRPVPLHLALEHAIEIARPGAESGGLEFRVALPPESVTVEGDLERLAQVFSNILSNAVKFTDPGGIIEITSRCDADRNAVAVHFRDTGIGMPPQLIPGIFDMFVQGDNSLARPIPGLGIGLSVVRTLVEMHGGTVEAHSAGSGQGSEFIVRLPCTAGPAPDGRSPTALQGSAPIATGRRVLVVDDNLDAAESLALLLGLSNYDVRVAGGSQEAAQTLSSFEPEIILLDIGLPGMDGYELARLIRGRPDTKNVILIAVTGYGQESDRARSRAAGFNHHLTKPIDFAQLETLLSEQ